MKLVVQPTKYSCTAACVAMITGVPIEMIFADLGHDGSERPFLFVEYAAVLNRYGYHLGMPAVEHAEGVSRFCRKDGAAIILARTSDGKSAHAVFWTGKRVLDPAGASKQLEEYRIIEWWPINKFQGVSRA